MKLDQLTVEEFTTPSPESVTGETKLQDVWQTMQDKGIRHILVTNNQGEVIGVVSQRDITTFSQAENFQQFEAQDVMSKDIFVTTPDTRLYEVALKMSQNKIGSAIISNGEQDSLGIFTATDALNALVEVLRGDLTP